MCHSLSLALSFMFSKLSAFSLQLSACSRYRPHPENELSSRAKRGIQVLADRCYFFFAFFAADFLVAFFLAAGFAETSAVASALAIFFGFASCLVTSGALKV